MVLSGFLGSGKTTLLNALLRHPSFESTAVIVNELGEIGLDDLLVTSAEEDVVLLGRVERVEAAEPEDMVWETDGVAHRAWRFRVVDEERVQDVRTGYEVTVSSPRERVVLMPVTAF